MTNSRHRTIAALLALPIAATFGASPSLAADRVNVVVSGGAMAATNPFLLPGTDTAGQSVFVEATPEYSSRSEISTLTLRGRARLEQYLERYSRDELYSADLDYSRKVSERVSLSAGGGFLSSRASSQAVLFGLQGTTGGTVQNPAPTLDVGTFGFGDRVRVLSGRLGAAIALSPRDNVTLDLGVSDNDYSGSTLYNFLSANQNLRYTRRLSERTDIYVSVNVTEANYRGRREGDAVIVMPVLGLRRQLSRTLELSGDVGASVARIADAIGTHVNSTTIAFHGQLCDNRERRQFCIRGSHAAQPTALGRVRRESRIDASYRLTLSENNQLQLNAAYGRSGESITNLALQPISLVNATAEFTHTIRRRLTLFASTGYGDLFQSGVARRANFQARAGVRYFFGALQ